MEQVIWEERNRFLLLSISGLIRQIHPGAKRGLDIGSQEGLIVNQLFRETGITFFGIEPFLESESIIKNGILLKRAWAHAIPFENEFFDVVTFTSVYEHIKPEYRLQSLKELYRVLRPRGILIGQMPNMNFPIELHSRLPFQQFLQKNVGEWYLRKFSPVSWRENGVNWYRVGPKQLKEDAVRSGFQESSIMKFNYPREIFSPILRKLYPIVSFFPLGYIFYFRK
jgi:SAM-dependent methyltransferase